MAWSRHRAGGSTLRPAPASHAVWAAAGPLSSGTVLYLGLLGPSPPMAYLLDCVVVYRIDGGPAASCLPPPGVPAEFRVPAEQPENANARKFSNQDDYCGFPQNNVHSVNRVWFSAVSMLVGRSLPLTVKKLLRSLKMVITSVVICDFDGSGYLYYISHIFRVIRWNDPNNSTDVFLNSEYIFSNENRFYGPIDCGFEQGFLDTLWQSFETF